jgi:hypothetical protein
VGLLARLGYVIWLAAAAFGGLLLFLVTVGAVQSGELMGTHIFVGIFALIVIAIGRAIRFVLAGD